MLILKMVQFRARTQNAESIIFHIGHRFGVPSDTCSDIASPPDKRGFRLQQNRQRKGRSLQCYRPCTIPRSQKAASSARYKGRRTSLSIVETPTQPVPSIDLFETAGGDFRIRDADYPFSFQIDSIVCLGSYFAANRGPAGRYY